MITEPGETSFLNKQTSLDDAAKSGSEFETLLKNSMGWTPSFHEFCTLKTSERGEVKTLEWSNVSYSIQTYRNAEPIQVLNGISGVAKTGEIVAVMGPSKSGKTKFLNTISGHVTATEGNHKLDGVVRIGNEPVSAADLLRYSGFVLKAEAMYPHSTVREALEFSGHLRLPITVSETARHALVQDLIASLGLNANDLVKNQSPGARKRLAIGVELMTLPSFLFLDEPVANLSPIESWQVMQTLHGLVANGKSSCLVILSLNETSSILFSQVSKLMLMNHGRVLFSGEVSGLEAWFQAKGLIMPPGATLADFALTSLQLAKPSTFSGSGGLDEVDAESGMMTKALARAQSSFASTLQASNKVKPEQRAGFKSQFSLLFHRYRVMAFREKKFFIARCLSSSVVYAIVACVFIGAGNVNNNQTYAIAGHLGSIVFTYFLSTFNTMIMSVLLNSDEKPVYIRERANGTYGILPSFLVKVLFELPVNLIVSVVIMLIMYWAVGYQANFGYFVLGLFLLTDVCYATGMVFAAILPFPLLGIGFTPAVLVPQLLFIGVFVRISLIPAFIQWPTYLSMVKYAINIPQIYEFSPSLCPNPIVCAQWSGLLASNWVYADQVGTYIGVLAGVSAVLRFLALVILEKKAGYAHHFLHLVLMAEGDKFNLRDSRVSRMAIRFGEGL